MRSPITPIASRAGIAAVAGMALIVGASPLLDQRRGPPRRTGRQGRPPRRHHRRLRLQGRRRQDDARPQRGRAPHPGRRQGRRRSARTRCTSSRSTATRTARQTSRTASGSPRRSPTATAARPRPTSSDAPTGAAAARNVWSGKVVATGLTTPYKHGVKVAHVMGGGAVFAGVRDDPFFFDLPGFVEFKYAAARRLDQPRHAARRLHRDRHVRRDQRPLDRDPAPERQARRHRQLDRRVRDHLHPVQRRLEADRPHGPAGDQHRVQRADPAGDLGLQRAREGRLQRPAPVRGPPDHDRQREDRAQRDRQRADGERRDRVHAGRGLGDRRRSCCPTSSRSRSAAPPRSPRGRRSGPWPSTAASSVTTSSTPSSRCSRTS